MGVVEPPLPAAATTTTFGYAEGTPVSHTSPRISFRKPESWTVEGNGVHFYAGVSDGRAFEVLFTQTVNPFANASERRWIPVTVDLSAYAGEEMDIILNTVASGPGVPPDERGDMPLWGAPEVVRR